MLVMLMMLMVMILIVELPPAQCGVPLGDAMTTKTSLKRFSPQSSQEQKQPSVLNDVCTKTTTLHFNIGAPPLTLNPDAADSQVSTARRVRSLFRTLARAQRTWPKEEERVYIQQELMHLRHEAKRLEDTPIARDLLDSAEKRLAIALHYGIAYPRVAHIPNANDLNKTAAVNNAMRSVID